MVGVSPLPYEVQVALRAARMRYAMATSAACVVAGTIAALLVLWRTSLSWRDLAILALMLALMVVANILRPFWIQQPVVRPVSLPAAAAAQAMVSALRDRAGTRSLAEGTFVEAGLLTMPAWFVDTPGGTWMATTTGTARHVDRRLAKTNRQAPL